MGRGQRTAPGLRRPRRAAVASLLTVLAVAVLDNAAGVSSTLYEGSPCFHEEGQLRGVCKLLPYCSWAVKERRSGLYPQTCSFDGYMPVVCCPYTRTHDPPHLPLRPHRPFVPPDMPALMAGMTLPPSPGALEMPPSSTPSTPPEQEKEEEQQEEEQQEQQTSGPVQLQAGVPGVLGPLESWPVPPIPSEPDHLKEEVDAVSALDRLGTGTSASTVTPQNQGTESSIQLGDGSAAFAHGR